MPSRAVYRKVADAVTLRRGPRLAAALLLACFASQALALDPNRSLTQFVHRIWQVQQGLPQATIFAIRQTSDGYLWLGTQGGLVRFDGVRFTPIRMVAGVSLENVWVRDLAADGDRGLWMATEGAGLIRYRDGAVTRYTTANGLPSDVVRCVLVDKSGGVWAATDSGLVSIVHEKLRRYGPADGLNLTNIRGMCESNDGSLWAGGDGATLAVWNGKAFVAHPLASLPGSVSVRSILCTHDGAVWVGSTSGLVRVKGAAERRFTAADGLADDWVFCLSDGHDESIYAGTKNGFSRLLHDRFETLRTRDGLSQSTVYALCHDREGSLWAGTKHGLNQFMDRRTTPYTTSEGLPSNDTGPVFDDGAGRIWIGTIGAGLSRFEGERFSLLTTRDGLASDTILALAGDSGGALWVGTDHGLNRLRNGKVEQTYTTAQGLPSDTIHSLLRDRSGTVWAGTAKGLAYLADGKFVEPADADGPLKSAVLALGERGNDTVLVATEGGGFYACTGARLRPVPQEGLPPRDIAAFYEDPDGLLWIGTRGGGLRLLDGAKTFTFSIKNGLDDDDIFGIVPDLQNNLWMACSKGIFSVSRAALRQFAAGQITSFKCMPFNPMDALRTIECKSGVQPAACGTRDGKVWFSTIHGLLVMDPQHQRKFPPVPVAVDDVIINGTSRSASQPLNLLPGESNLEFRYTALSFLVPTRITFRYMLEGFDKGWVDAGARREAFYTNLAPGSYRFRVQAQSVDGIVTELPSPLAITLEPQIYQRRWFVPLCVAVLLSIAWIAYQLRVTRIREQLHAVVTERSRIARELHDTLMQGFSGITMEMQAVCMRLAPSPERGTLEDIIRDAGTCLREARQSIAGLRTSKVQNSGLLASIAQTAKQMTEARDVRLKLKLDTPPGPLPAEAEYNLLRIAQEAVSNSVKHSGARTIEVCLDRTPTDVRLSVKDDGTGLKNGSENGAFNGHYGLIGMKERATQIGADLQIKSEPGRGTTVSVTLPAAYNSANGDSHD